MTPEAPHPRVLLADDHRLVIEGISNLLSINGIKVVGIANDGLEAVALAQTLRPDLILMDVRMPRCDGLSATRLIKAAQPEMKIVMLTTSTESQDLFEAVKSGASGYLLKTMGRDAFLSALRDAEQGIPPFAPGLAALLLSEFARMAGGEGETRGQGNTESDSPYARVPASPLHDTSAPTHPHVPDSPNPLTAHQSEILSLVAGGLTYNEVAAQLSISERTVRYQMTKIMDRLHLYNRAQVLAYAGKMGLKPPDK
jgi:two-component system NarL family response regulator